MTKQQILDHFYDINLVYNNCNKLNDLSTMLDELLKEQQAEIERLKEQPPKWIPVDERLPEEDGFYLVCNRGFLPWIAELRTFMGMRGWCSGASMPVVKMWMPLPKTPKDGDGE